MVPNDLSLNVGAREVSFSCWVIQLCGIQNLENDVTFYHFMLYALILDRLHPFLIDVGLTIRLFQGSLKDHFAALPSL